MPKDSGDSEGHEPLFGTDSSAEDSKSKDNSDTKVEVDWDSDDNPWKNRAKGFQSDASKARSELDSRNGSIKALERIEAGLETVHSRIDLLEEFSAEDGDSRGPDDPDDDDADDSQSRRSTNARTERLTAAREERSKTSDSASHTALVSEVREKIS